MGGQKCSCEPYYIIICLAVTCGTRSTRKYRTASFRKNASFYGPYRSRVHESTLWKNRRGVVAIGCFWILDFGLLRQDRKSNNAIKSFTRRRRQRTRDFKRFRDVSIVFCVLTVENYFRTNPKTWQRGYAARKRFFLPQSRGGSTRMTKPKNRI